MDNKYTVFSLLLFLLAFNALQAQEKLWVKKSEFNTQGKGGIAALQKVRKADQLMDKGLGYTKGALDLYLQAFNYNKENAELNYKIGVCYLICGPKKDALPYLKHAYSLKPEVSKDIHFLLGSAYQINAQFSEAIVEYKSALEFLQQQKTSKLSSEQIELMKICEKRLRECRSAQDFYASPENVQLNNMGASVNSSYDEYSPLEVAEGKLFFCSRRTDNLRSNRAPQDAKFYENVYQAELTGAQWTDVKKLHKNVNQGRNAAVRGLVDNNNMILYKGEKRYGDLYQIQRTTKGWKSPGRIPGINKKKSHEASGSVTADGKTMYFVSNRSGGHGKHDIYVTARSENGRWTSPTNLGPEINTPYDEGDVFISGDGNTLFFSSKGHNTMGGYDNFKVEKESDGQWGIPVNLGYPLNSTDNDITYYQSENGKIFFASDRDGGQGGFDLYEIYVPSEDATVLEADETNTFQLDTLPLDILQTDTVQMNIFQPDTLRMDTLEMDPFQSDTLQIDTVRVDTVQFLLGQIETEGVPEVPTFMVASDPLVKEIDENTLQEGIVSFRVQIASERKELSMEELLKSYKGSEAIDYVFMNDRYRYTIGNFKTYEEAEKLQSSCGVKGAFIVVVKNGKLIDVAQKIQ